MKAALTLLMVAAGALGIRYAYLGRNPWDDVLAIIRGTWNQPPNVSTGMGANANQFPQTQNVPQPTFSKGGTVRSVTGSN